MKKLMNRGFGIFLVVAFASAPLHGVKVRAKKVEAPIERVTQGVSALEQIMDQVRLIVEFEDPTSLAHAKKQLISLMGNKALNPKIKEVIKEDIEIIEQTTDSSRKAAQQAYERLKVVAKQVEAQANVVAAIEEGAALVKNAPMDAKEEAIKTAQEKIEEAQQEQGWLQYLYTGAKRVITAPVNYVFGEESSKAKTAFYATVGAAVLAAGGFAVGVQYGREVSEEPVNKPISEQAVKKPIDVENNIPVSAEKRIRIPSEEEKQSLLDIFRKNSLHNGFNNIERLSDKWKYSSYESQFLWKDDKWSYTDKKKMLEDSEFAINLKKIAKDSELVINKLVSNLRKWVELANKAILLRKYSSMHSNQQINQAFNEARLLYDESVLPIKSTLISDGVIDAMDYLDWERKITGLVFYYD